MHDRAALLSEATPPTTTAGDTCSDGEAGVLPNDYAALVHAVERLEGCAELSSVRPLIRHLRRLVARIFNRREFQRRRFRRRNAGASRPMTKANTVRSLPPRQRDVLEGLKIGLSEKQIAEVLGISAHSVHVHVRLVYRHFGVCSRGELLALWLRR
jgi:DNA-binding NarL/FixJ family response regulator